MLMLLCLRVSDLKLRDMLDFLSRANAQYHRVMLYSEAVAHVFFTVQLMII